jgi:BASS family bile acid:Na+ symporter
MKSFACPGCWQRVVWAALGIAVLLIAPEADSFTPTVKAPIEIPSKTVAVFPRKTTKWRLSSDDSFGSSSPRRKGVAASLLSKCSLLAPVWTSLAALYVTTNPSASGFFVSSKVIHNSLLTLMFAMGLAITPNDISKALSDPKLLGGNAILCYGMVPLAALLLSKQCMFSGPEGVGLLLLGSVSGGQASNLFTLISGGDVALSVICTLSTTLLGVFATPLLVKLLWGQTLLLDVQGVVISVASLVLLPLVSGLGFGQVIPARIIQTISPTLPVLGVLATMVLVAGGASNLSLQHQSFQNVVLPSCLLCLISGAMALWFVNTFLKETKEASKRALVIETISESPSLAYVLACRHFESSAAAVPAAAMVTLAILGAMVASLWSMFAPIGKVKAEASGDSY